MYWCVLHEVNFERRYTGRYCVSNLRLGQLEGPHQEVNQYYV